MRTPPPTGDDGELVTEGDTTVLRFERRYHAPIEVVWDAITSPERLRRWLFATTFEPRAGGTMRTDLGEHGTVEGRVLAWDEPRLLEYEWREPAGSDTDEVIGRTWHVRFSLRADGDETELVFEHLLPEPGPAELAAGWHWHLDRLRSLLAGSAPAAVVSDDDFERLLAHYRAR